MDNALRFVDADGHILEHPTGMLDYAPAEWRDRIWHIETDADGEEWTSFYGARRSANSSASAGTAGMSNADRERAMRRELKYTEVRPAAYNVKPRLEDMTADDIDISVLYPTLLLGLPSHPDVEFAEVQCRAYNGWLSDHCAEGEGRLYGAAMVPQQDIERAAAEIRRAARLPFMVAAFLRPNPTAGKHFLDPVYDPIWEAAADTGLPIGFHPFLEADLPGACVGLSLSRLGVSRIDLGPEAEQRNFDNIFFTQAIANPVDMMTTLTFITAGGVGARFPDTRFVFLEANGGWLVPWLERLDHHYDIFGWDVPTLKMPPSEYFRRQCWISFDADESTLAFTANSPLCGADRIIWASDYPHPDAKFPGVTQELREAIAPLDRRDQQLIAGDNALELYGISD